MLRGQTMEFEGKSEVDVRFTNHDRMRYTVNAAVAGNGNKLPVSTIWRSTSKKGNTPRWYKRYSKKPSSCKCFFTKGGSQSVVSMIAWIKDILLPYVESHGGGKNSQQWTLLILDPATAHRDASVKKLLSDNKILLAMMPASTTYRFQMIDVVVGKPFKDSMCNLWATWMLEQSEKIGVTKAGNYKHARQDECCDWVVDAWKKLSMAGVVKKAPSLGMTSDLGPEWPGYKPNKKFANLVPTGEEEEVLVADIADDLSRADREDSEDLQDDEEESI